VLPALRVALYLLAQLPEAVSPPPAEDLLDELQEAAERDLGDFLVFRVGAPKPMTGAPMGSLRFSVEARPAVKPFRGFALDVGQSDEPLGEADWKKGQADLGFADIGRARMAVHPLADHFAEKLHTYTRPRERRTRVKDLLDLSVILEDLADASLPSPTGTNSFRPLWGPHPASRSPRSRNRCRYLSFATAHLPEKMRPSWSILYAPIPCHPEDAAPPLMGAGPWGFVGT
jgi:hypothetical protein